MLILAPILTLLTAIVFGLLQLGCYLGLRRLRWIGQDAVPIFPVLVFRGLLMTLGCIAVFAMISKSGMKFWEDPFLSPDAQEAYKKILDREGIEQRRQEHEKNFYEQQSAPDSDTDKEDASKSYEVPMQPESQKTDTTQQSHSTQD